MKAYSLLVYVGEVVDLYLIPDKVAAKHKKTLIKSQNKFINSDNLTFPMEKLSAFLAEKPSYVPDKKLKKFACKWVKYKISMEKPIEGKKISSVYFSGFIP